MMKKILLLLIFILSINPVLALALSDINLPKNSSGRLGVGEKPENAIETYAQKQIENENKTPVQKAQNETILNNKSEIVHAAEKNLEVEKAYKKDKVMEAFDSNPQTYADLSIKRMAQEISDEVNESQEKLMSDLSILWVAAAQNSETIQYAVYKLSNPDENKPDDNMLKKIIKPIASFSTIAGTAFASNPLLASGALIGGNLMGALASDDKQLNYKFTKVTDADMVILVRKIDDLQKRLLLLYVDYKTKQEIYDMALKNVEKREQIYKDMQNKSKEELILADVYYRNAQNFANKAKHDYTASRTILKQLVGERALLQIENPA